MSLTWGRWPLPQQVWKRTSSVGMPRNEWLMISTLSFEEGAVLRHIPIGIEHPRCAELRFIDLHDKAGVGDRLVFLETCIGDRCHVVVFIGIVLVADAGTETEWSECGEIALDVLAGDRRLKVGDIALHRGLSGICHGTGAASTFLLGGIERLSWNREARPDRAA